MADHQGAGVLSAPVGRSATGKTLSPSDPPRVPHRRGRLALAIVVVAGTFAESGAPGLQPFSDELVSRASEAAFAAVVLGAIAWLFSCPVVSRRQTAPLGSLLIALALVTAVAGTVVGVEAGNALSLIVGDAARMGITAACIYWGNRLVESDRVWCWGVAWKTFCCLEIARAVVFAGFGVSGSFTRIGGGSAIALALAIGGRESGTWQLAPRLSTIGTIAMTLNLFGALVRSLWVAAIVEALLWAIVVGRRRPGQVGRRLLVAAALCGAVLFVADGFGVGLTSRLVERIALTQDRASDPSAAVRDAEHLAAEQQYQRLGAPVLGAGFGAEFPQGAVTVHQIHSTSYSLFFRNGVLGTVVWIALASTGALAALWLLLARVRAPDDTMVLIGVVGVLLTSTSYYSLVGVVPACLFVGRASAIVSSPRRQ